MSATQPRRRAFPVVCIAVAVLLAVLALVLGVSSGAPATQPTYSTVTARPNDRAECKEASDLINAGHPDDAITLVKDTRAEAKANDKTYKGLCAAQMAQAIVAKGQLERGASASPSVIAGLAYRWNSFASATAVPLQGIALAALGIFVSMLLLARVALVLPGQPYALPALIPVSSTRRRIGGVACVIVMGITACTTAISLTLDAGAQFPAGVSPFVEAMVLALSLQCGLAASLCFSSILAARLRISIDVQGTSVDASIAPRLAALLTEIGGALPRGVEAPVGSDVTALRDNVVALKSSSAWVSALQSVAGWLLVSAPWRLVLGVTPDGTSLSVVITRNGHLVRGFTIAPQSVLPANIPATTVASASALTQQHLLDFAAAAVVSTLARYYLGFEGLCGTTDWKSLGLQYIATTAQLPIDQKRRFLSWSLNADPRNLLALIALERLRSVSFTGAVDLKRYRDWLTETLLSVRAESRGTVEARVRLSLSLVVTSLNIRGFNLGATASYIEAECTQLLTDINRIDPQSPLYKQILPAAQIASACAGLSKSRVPETGFLRVISILSDASPFAAYNAACYFALALESSGIGARVPDAKRSLEQALTTATLDPQYAIRASDDPILKKFKDEVWFKHLTQPLWKS